MEPLQHQAIIWSSADLLSFGPSGTYIIGKSKYKDLLSRKYAWQCLQNVSDLLKPQCVAKRYLDGKSCWTWMSISVIPSCLFLSESEILQHFRQHQLHISIGQNACRNHHGNKLTMGIQYSGLYIFIAMWEVCVSEVGNGKFISMAKCKTAVTPWS